MPLTLVSEVLTPSSVRFCFKRDGSKRIKEYSSNHQDRIGRWCRLKTTGCSSRVNVILRTQEAALNNYNSSSKGSDALSGLRGYQALTWYTDIHVNPLIFKTSS